MKHKISAILMLSLMLSMTFMPMAVSADDGKSIIKDMVQAPSDYSVGITIWDYIFDDFWGRGYLGYMDAYDRAWYPPWKFFRLKVLD